jgi:hypothetical protein
MKDRGIKFGRRSSFVAPLLAFVGFFASPLAVAADEIRVETVLSNLRGPSAVAVRQSPGADGYEIFVAEIGAGRIVRLHSDKPKTSEEAITGFIASTDDDDFIRLPGSHGMLFLDANRLVVAGSEGEGRPFVRLYELTDQEKPRSAEQHEQQASPASDKEQSDDGIASFHGLARTLANDKVPDFLVVSALDDESSTTLWRVPVRSGTLGDLSPLSKVPPGPAEMAIAVEPRGHIVVVRPAGRGDSAASRLEFVNPMDGRTVVQLPLELANVAGIAYSPRTGNLYAIGRSSSDAPRDGIYRIDSNESSDAEGRSAIATFVAEVERPTAMAFGPDGALYIVALGRDRNGGKLHKITGGL